MTLATKHRDRPHARIYAEWMYLPAWKALSPEAVTLLVALMAQYRPTEGNSIALSERRAAELAHCSRPTAAKALVRLVKLGWLEVEAVGSMTGALAKRAPRYSLTCQPRYLGEVPKQIFLHWRPPPNGEKTSRRRPKFEPDTAKERANDNPSNQSPDRIQTTDILPNLRGSSRRPIRVRHS